MMRHNYLRYWLFIFVTALAAAAPRALADDAGVIYLIDFGKAFSQPITANEQHLTKLNETAPGSNIYVGQHEFNGNNNYFRFVSKLQDPSNFSWRLDNICPLTDSEIPSLGKSGVYFATNVNDTHELSPLQEPGAWNLKKSGEYQITVDLNANTMKLINVYDYLVIFNDSSRPTADTFEQYSSLFSLYQYVKPGNLEIYLYSPFEEAWLNIENPSYEYGYFVIYGSLAQKGEPVKINNWPGGILKGGYSTLTLNPDSPILPDDYSAEQIYLIGDFCGWDFSKAPAFTSSDFNGKIFNFSIPAGTQFFKLSNVPGWDNPLGYAGNISKNASGEFVIGLAPGPMQPNISFDSPLTSDLDAVLDLTNFTLTVDGSAPLTEEASGAVSINPDNLYISYSSDEFVLNSDSPKSIIGTFSSIPKVADNEWSGQIYIPASNFKLRFYGDLTPAGQPNKMIAPASGKDSELVFNDGYAYALTSLQHEDKATYWTSSNWKGGSVKVTVKKQGDQYSLVFDQGSDVGASQIYLIGSQTGWVISDDTMPLQLTDKGGYYGHYPMPVGETYFRIYTSLGDWSVGSVGSDPGYENIDLIVNDNQVEMPCFIGGEGCWVLTDWDGSDLYFYADLNAAKVIFSKTPIAQAGEIITEIPRNPVQDGPFCSIDEGSLASLTPLADGVYSYSFSQRPYNVAYGSHSYRFFTRSTPFAHDDNAWKGSYTISFKGEPVADLTKGIYAEFDIEINDELGSDPATPLTLITHDQISTNGEIILDLNNKKAYVADFGQYIILYKGEETPNAMNIRQYDDRISVGSNSGILLNIPADKFDIILYNPSYSEIAGSETVAFDSDGFAIANNGSLYGWNGYNLASPDWHGGPVYINPGYLFDFSKVAQIAAVTPDYQSGSSENILSVDPADPMIYKGIVNFAPVEDASYPFPHYLSFLIAEKEAIVNSGWGDSQRYFSLSLSAPVLASGIGGYSNYDSRNLYFSQNEVKSSLGFNSLAFYLLNIDTSAKLDVTLDLNSMTIDAKVVEGSAQPVSQIVSPGNIGFDGIKSYRSSDRSSLQFIDATNVDYHKGNYSFNLVTDRSTAIIPASGANTLINFDKTGSWKGQYKEVASADAHAKADQSAAWTFEIPEDGLNHINMVLNEKDKTITIHSMVHNTGFFISNNFTFPRVDNLENDSEEMLLPTERQGVLAGSFKYDGPTEWGASNLRFASQPISLSHNLHGYYYGLGGNNGNNAFDLTDADSSTSNAWNCYSYNGSIHRYPSDSWNFIAEPGTYDAVYDANHNTLTISRHLTGIEDIFDNISVSEKVNIIPGQGYVTLIAAQPMVVNFYNISGMLIKSVNIEKGTSVIDIDPGFYIAAGNKIIVR